MKRMICISLVALLVCLMAACSSGASNTPAPVSASENGEAVPTTEDESSEEGELAETEDGTEAAEKEMEAEEVDELGFTESQKQQLFDCIAESVKANYLEPNRISVEDFKWPDYNNNGIDEYIDEYNAWRYFSVIWSSYRMNDGETYDASNMPMDFPPDEICVLMNSVLDGIDNWYHMPENVDSPLVSVQFIFDPANEAIPENVHFAE